MVLGRWLIALCVPFISCTSVYVPSSRNVPLLSKRGEFQGSVSLGNATNAQAAYAISDHIAISANGLYANNKWLHNYGYRIHQSAEVALGYFAKQKKISFEVFGGYGAGKGHGRDSTIGFLLWAGDQETAEGRYTKFFLQPSIGFNVKRCILAVTTRVTYIDFNEINLTVNNFPISIMNKPVYFFEPSFMAKFYTMEKSTSVFVFAQAGLNFAFQDLQYEPVFFDYSFLHYSIGVGIRLSKRE